METRMVKSAKLMIWMVIISIILLGMTSCHRIEEEVEEPHGNYYVPSENTHFPEQENVISVQTFPDSLKMVFAGTPPEYHVGDILVGTEGTGFLRKIVATPEIRGDTLIVRTEEALVTEAFKEMYIDTVVTLYPEGKGLPPIDTTYSFYKNGKRYTTHIKSSQGYISPANPKDGSFTLVFPNVIVEISDASGEIAFSFSIDTVKFVKTINADVQIVINLFNLEYMRFAIIENSTTELINFNFDASSSLLDIDRSFQLAEIPIGGFVTGPIPWVISLGLNVGVDVEASLSIGVSIDNRIRTNTYSRIGAEYENGTWTPIGERTINADIGTPHFDTYLTGELSAKVPYFDGTFSVKIFDVLGPEIYIKPFPYTDINSSLYGSGYLNIAYGLGVGIDLGGRLSMRKLNLPDFDLQIAEYKFPVLEASTLIPLNPSEDYSIELTVPTGASVDLQRTAQLTGGTISGDTVIWYANLSDYQPGDGGAHNAEPFPQDVTLEFRLTENGVFTERVFSNTSQYALVTLFVASGVNSHPSRTPSYQWRSSYRYGQFYEGYSSVERWAVASTILAGIMGAEFGYLKENNGLTTNMTSGYCFSRYLSENYDLRTYFDKPVYILTTGVFQFDNTIINAYPTLEGLWTFLAENFSVGPEGQTSNINCTERREFDINVEGYDRSALVAHAWSDIGGSCYISLDGDTVVEQNGCCYTQYFSYDFPPNHVEIGLDFHSWTTWPRFTFVAIADSVYPSNWNEWRDNVQNPSDSWDHNPAPVVLRIDSNGTECVFYIEKHS